MSTIKVLGEIRLVGANASQISKLNTGVEKVSSHESNTIELDPGDDTAIDFGVVKEFVYFDCNKPINYSLNDSVDKFAAHRVYLAFGTSISKITFYNDNGDNPVKVVINLVSANGDIF